MKLDELTDVELVAATIAGEARGESITGQIAVGCTIRNRVNHPGWWGKSWRGVVLAHATVSGREIYQFSCWHPDDPNRAFIDSIDFRHPDTLTDQLLWIAVGVYLNKITDITNGANHYHAIYADPSWKNIDKIVFTAGKHIFYKL